MLAGSLISCFIFPCIVTMYLCSMVGPRANTTGISSTVFYFLSLCKSVLYPFNNTSVFLESSQIVAVARLGLHRMLGICFSVERQQNYCI